MISESVKIERLTEILDLLGLEDILDMNNIEAIDVLLYLYNTGQLSQPEHLLDDTDDIT